MAPHVQYAPDCLRVYAGPMRAGQGYAAPGSTLYAVA
jgi:hypothetical protein